MSLLAAEHVVGRLSTSALPLNASFVSTAHALLRWNGEAWEARDLGSTNGTFVDGRRIAIGASVRLKTGVELVFGEADETWQMVDDRAPVVIAIPLDGGEPSYCVSGSIPIPTPDEPIATIYSDGARWVLETDQHQVALRSGQLFTVAGREWRFECSQETVATGTSQTRLRYLADIILTFEVSSNEEHVGLTINSGSEDHELGQRTCFYLALVLLRRRIADRDARLSDPGWVDLESILKMVPEYGSGSHLNVEIFRLRRALFDAGVLDAALIVERRRGEVRLGIDRARIVKSQTPRGDRR